MYRKLCFLVSFVLLLCLSANVQAVVVTFNASADAPTPGPHDVNSLLGGMRDANNVGTATTDGPANDPTTYAGHDRGAQGQTFVTGSSEPVYQITGVWIRHVDYTYYTPNIYTWYQMPTNGQMEIRITNPAASGTDGFVISSEIYTTTGSEPNKLPAGTTSTYYGTGTWIHFVLDNPVPVGPGVTYGFDIAGRDTPPSLPNTFFELYGIKDSAPDGNPYTSGTAYNSGWGGGTGTNELSEAPGDRVFIVELLTEVPLKASVPYPADYADDASQSVTLTWVPGLYAAEHHVYFGDNYADVEAGTGGTDKGTVSEASYPPGALTPGETYYWRIDEVNDSHPDELWPGDVWRFTVTPTKAWAPSPYDGEICVFINPTNLSWNPGSEANQSKLYFGTTSGSLSLETTINHDGSERYSYDKAGLSNGQDYYWQVDEFNSVTSTTWMGDEWHFTTIPVITPPDPHLVGWWKFDEGPGKAIDWSGLGQHGDVYGTSSITGYDMGAIEFDGLDDYVSLPIDSTLSTLNSATIATWVNFYGGAAWQRIFDFGTDPGTSPPTEYMFLTPDNGGGLPHFDITTAAGTSTITGTYTLPTGWHHVAVVIDGDYSEMTLYLDAAFVAIGPTTSLPSDIIDANDNKLGESKFWDPPDPHFAGSLDDFRIYDYAMTQEQVKGLMASKEAWLPEPADYATGVDRNPVLSWQPGRYAASASGHELYYSTEFNDVNERIGNPVVLTDPCYAIPSPNAPYESLQTIYWVVDEVNDAHTDKIWLGTVWRFTIKDYSIIDDFEAYTGTGKSAPPPQDSLKSVWVDGNYSWDLYGGIATSGSLVQLNTDTKDGSPTYTHYTSDDNDIYLSEEQSMKFYYDNDGSVTWQVDLYNGHPPDVYTYTPSPDTYLSEAYAAIDDAAQTDPDLDSLDMMRDWSGYNVLGLSFYGDVNNTTNNAGLYVGLEDGDGTLVTIAHPDPTQLTEASWHDWYIKLSDFTDKNAGLALGDIAKIYIGFGDKDSPASGGTGVVFFDDIQLFTGVCIAGSVVGDFDDDCVINYSDLEILTYGLPGEMPTMPTPIIELDADDLDASHNPGDDVTSWKNIGSLHEGSFFTDTNAVDTNEPVFDEILGRYCVTFDANDMLVWDYNAPATITSDKNEPNDFTIIYEVYNPQIAYEEILFTWAQRGGPAATGGGVGYGTAEPWGAVVHWNEGGLEPDMGFDRGLPAAEQWHIIGVTYDSTTEALAVDGALHNLEDKDLAIYMDQPVTIGAPYQPESDPNAAWITLRSSYIPVFTNYRYTGSIASIKVYAEAIPPGDLAILTASLAGLPKAETDVKPDGKIDFGDLAVLGNNWMQDPVLFGDD